MPDAQPLQAVQDAPLADVLNVPAVQAAHCRSLLDPAIATTCVPGSDSQSLCIHDDGTPHNVSELPSIG